MSRYDIKIVDFKNTHRDGLYFTAGIIPCGMLIGSSSLSNDSSNLVEFSFMVEIKNLRKQVKSVAAALADEPVRFEELDCVSVCAIPSDVLGDGTRSAGGT